MDYSKMSTVELIIDGSQCDEDILFLSEKHADKVKFHSSFSEYVFSDESVIIINL